MHVETTIYKRIIEFPSLPSSNKTFIFYQQQKVKNRFSKKSLHYLIYLSTLLTFFFDKHYFHAEKALKP